MKQSCPYVNAAKLGLLVLIVLWSDVAFSQNYPLTNSYLVNPYLYNPAEAGSKNLQAFSNYRVQWVGMQGAPKYISAGANTLINNTRAGIGFKAGSFTRGFLTTSEFNLSYAYGIPLSKTSKLHFGLSGGVLMNNVDFSKISIADGIDPALQNLTKSAIPSVSFGFVLKNTNGFNFGVVIPQMIRSYNLDANFEIVPQDNLMVMASYSNWTPQTKVNSHNKSKRTVKSKKNKGSPFEAFLLYRYSKLGGQAEITGRYNLQSLIWLSATYRQNSGIIPGVGFNLNKLTLQYSYESGLAGDLPLKSHEVFLMARIGEPKKFKGDAEAKPKTAPVPVPKSGPRLNNNSMEPSVSKVDPKTSKNSQKNNTVAKNTPTEKKPPETKPVVKKEPVVTQTEVKKDPVVETKPEEKKEPVVTQTEVKKDPVVETKPEEKKDPVVTQTDVKKDPVVETKPEEKKDPVVTQTEVKKDPVVVTKPEEKKDPVVTQTEVKKDPVVVTKPEEKKDPVVTQTEVKKDPVVETKPEEKKDPVVTQTEVKKDPVVETKPEEKKDPLQLTDEEQHEQEQDKLSRIVEHADNPTEEHEEEGHPHAERHEFVRRGDHQAEMDLGDYVIVGVFRGEVNAKRFSDELKKLGFSEVDYGFLSNKNIWYVHIAGSDDIEEARVKRNKYRKMKLFKDAWLLTVHQ